MRFVRFIDDSGKGLAIRSETGDLIGLSDTDKDFPGDLDQLIEAGPNSLSSAAQVLLKGRAISEDALTYLPPLSRPNKILCIGLNYVDHSKEMSFTPPDYPTVFARFPTTLSGHKSTLEKPEQSEQLDFEGEIAAIIGKAAYKVSAENALDHVAGYSLFNDISVRDYQTKSPQWTMGKNFDGTGAFGPEFVTADELPPGIKGLKIETHLNGSIVQSATTDDMIFDVATLIAELSDVLTLEPGDIIVTGTPAGVGMARTPPLWMKAGDKVEIIVEKLGQLETKIT